jgi:hypothetical protein
MGFTVKETAVTLAPSLGRDTTHLCIASRQPGKAKFLPGDRVRQRGGHKVLLASPVFQSGADKFQPGSSTIQPGAAIFQSGNPKFLPGDAKILPGILKILPGNANFLPGCLIFNRLRQINHRHREIRQIREILADGHHGGSIFAYFAVQYFSPIFRSELLTTDY